jgi:hypothetical protein
MIDGENLMYASVPLRRGGLMRIADARGMLLRVRRGNVWITEEGDPRDYFLRAGGQFTISGRGTALVSALEASLLALSF